MKHFLWGGLLVLLFAAPVMGFKAGVFVDSPSGLMHDCVEIGGRATAKQILEQSRFDTTYSYGGMFLDSINGLANDFANSKSWFFFNSQNGNVLEAQVGVADYAVEDEEEFVYFGYYGYDENFKRTGEPQDVGFFDACPSEANQLELREVYVDTGADEYLDANDSIVFGNPGDQMTLYVRLSNYAETDELGSGHEVRGDVKFGIGDESYDEDFDVEPSETQTIGFPFAFPYSSPGHYTANVYVNGADEFDSYSMNKRVILGVAAPTTTTKETTTTIGSEPVKDNPQKPDETPTGAAVAAPQGTRSGIIVIVLFLVLLASIAVLIIVLRR